MALDELLARADTQVSLATYATDAFQRATFTARARALLTEAQAVHEAETRALVPGAALPLARLHARRELLRLADDVRALEEIVARAAASRAPSSAKPAEASPPATTSGPRS